MSRFSCGFTITRTGFMAEDFISGRVCSHAFDPRFTIPGTAPQYSPDRNFQIKHVKLELDVDLKKKTVSGVCHTDMVSFGAKSLTLNAVDMKILYVKINGKKVKYTYDTEKIVINFRKEVKYGHALQVTVDYKLVNPKLGVYFVQPDKHYPKKPWQAWTHSEAEDARYWYPCMDIPESKATTESLITVSSDLFALSNGKLMGVHNNKKRKTKTYHWKMSSPHSPYLFMFAIGRFSEVKDKWKNVDVLYYCEKGKEEDIKRGFGKTPKMLDFFSKKIGVDYPYEKYAQVVVEDFIYGGMEHTTASTQIDWALLDKIAAKEVWDFPQMLAAHELAHQWFGDLITCKDWSHIWLNEGFAEYFESLFAEHDAGKDMFMLEMYRKALAYFDEDTNAYRRPIVTNVYMSPNDIFDRTLYQKGAWVLHMIRCILGEDLWWKAIHHYVKSNFNSSADTADLISAIRQATGFNMKKFFDQWVFKAGYPEYLVKYHWDSKKKEAQIRVIQQQQVTEETPLFSMPVVLEFHTKNGMRTFRETAENKQHIFKYKFSSEPANFRFDPENWILKKLTLLKPRRMWYLDLRDKNLIGKIRAAQYIASLGSDADTKLLERVLYSEKFWGAQVEIALTIGNVRTDTSLHILLRALDKLKHPRVVRAVLDALGHYRGPKIAAVAKKYASLKNSYIIPAEAVRTLGRTRIESMLPAVMSGLKRKSWGDVIGSSAVLALAQLNNEKAFNALKKLTKYGYPTRIRELATKSLGSAGKGKPEVVDLLLGLTYDKYVMVQLNAVAALGELGDERAIKRLKEITEGHYESRVKRTALESIKKIQPWMETDLKTSDLTEKIEELKRENAEIRKKAKK